MRPGLLEIAIIIGLIILVVVLTRVALFKKHTNGKSQGSGIENVKQETTKRKKGTSRSLKSAGVVLVIIGITLLFAGMTLFKWAISTCAWSLLIVGIGLVLAFIFGRR